MQGFDCTDGGLTPLNGYWMDHSIPLSGVGFVPNSTNSAYRCLNARACIGYGGIADPVVGGKCADGYEGTLCSKCAPGWAGLTGFCTECYSAGLASIGILLLTSVIAVAVAIVTAVFLEENTGTSPVSSCCLCGLVFVNRCCVVYCGRPRLRGYLLDARR